MPRSVTFSLKNLGLQLPFQVELPIYRGPLDLLLFLVRRQELDITSLSVSQVVDQYLGYLDILQSLDVDGTADFLELAATLIELKSQAVLPQTDDPSATAEEKIEYPQDQLVARLLEYKRVRDAASVLDELADRWQQRYGRMADDLPTRRVDPGEEPLVDLELWDLVSAFGRIIREAKGPPPTQVIYDETPIHVHMQRVHAKVINEGTVRFGELFEPKMHKTSLIGLFLAVLELTRHHGVIAKQGVTGDEIDVMAGPQFNKELNVAQVDNYRAEQLEKSNIPARMR